MIWCLRPPPAPLTIPAHLGYYCSEPGFELLGGCVSNDPIFASVTLQRKVAKSLKTIEAILSVNDPQICLLLLRYTAGMTKLSYLWRTMNPQVLMSSIGLVENTIYDALSFIVTNHRPGFGIPQLHLASLPLHLGGLAIPLPSDYQKFAHLAAQLQTEKLQYTMFGMLPPLDTALVGNFYEALTPQCQVTWHNTAFPLGQPQKVLAKLYYESKRHHMLDNGLHGLKTSIKHAAAQSLLLASLSLDSSSKEIVNLSHQWLLALPNTGLHMTMLAAEYRAVLCMRLLIPLRSSSIQCGHCKGIMDNFGYHALSCNGPDNRRILRHDTVVQAIKDLAVDFHAQVNAPVQCIGVSTYANQSLRPADILIKDKDNQNICIDVTIVSPLSISKEFQEAGLVVGALVLQA